MQVKSKWDCQDEDSTLGGTRSSLQPRDCGGKKNQLFYLGRGDWWRHDYKKQHLFCLFFILGVHGIQIYRVESNKLMKEVLFLFMPPQKNGDGCDLWTTTVGGCKWQAFGDGLHVDSAFVDWDLMRCHRHSFQPWWSGLPCRQECCIIFRGGFFSRNFVAQCF
jgi:hypothetical protein